MLTKTTKGVSTYRTSTGEVTSGVALAWWEPGNGTRYRLAAIRLALAPEGGKVAQVAEDSIMLTWLDGSSSGRSMMWRPDAGPVDVNYLAEKLSPASDTYQLSDADAEALAAGFTALLKELET